MTTELKSPFPQATAPVEDDEMLMFEDAANAATQGHWGWFGNTDNKEFYLATRHGGREFVMLFVRYGMQKAQPMFQVMRGENGIMTKASELVRYEVCPEAGPNRKDRRVYRGDISGFDHPDATFMEVFSPTNVVRLLNRVRELEAALEHEVKLGESIRDLARDAQELAALGKKEAAVDKIGDITGQGKKVYLSAQQALRKEKA